MRFASSMASSSGHERTFLTELIVRTFASGLSAGSAFLRNSRRTRAKVFATSVDAELTYTNDLSRMLFIVLLPDGLHVLPLRPVDDALNGGLAHLALARDLHIRKFLRLRQKPLLLPSEQDDEPHVIFSELRVIALLAARDVNRCCQVLPPARSRRALRGARQPSGKR